MHSPHASLPVPGADVLHCLYVTPWRAGCCQGQPPPPLPPAPSSDLELQVTLKPAMKRQRCPWLSAGGPAATALALSWKAHLGQNPCSWLVGLTLCSHSLIWECTIGIEGHHQILCQKTHEAPLRLPTCRDLSSISSPQSWWIFNKHEGLVFSNPVCATIRQVLILT